MKVKAHILRNEKLEGWRDKIAGQWSYRQLAADAKWSHGWISFDAVTFNPDDGQVYCGLNSIDGDFLYRFDPGTGRFEGLNTRQWAGAYDVKIHRTILHHPSDHCLYFGTSMLHDMDEQQHAPGGKLARYDPARNQFDILAVPAPRLYLQSIAADWGRDLIYSFSYPAEAVYKTGIRSKHSDLVAYIGNAIFLAQPHNAVVDRHGWLWGTWAETRAWDESNGPQPIRLFKYHPDNDQFVWFDYGLPRWEDHSQMIPERAPATAVTSVLAQTRHRQDFGFCDSMAYDGDRFIYAGTVAGVLARIDIENGKVEKVANAITTGRFPALAICGGVLYGAGGMHGHTQLVRWNTPTGGFTRFTDLVDPSIGQRPARVHELAVDPSGCVYLAENDNHERSSFLWSVTLD